MVDYRTIEQQVTATLPLHRVRAAYPMRSLAVNPHEPGPLHLKSRRLMNGILRSGKT